MSSSSPFAIYLVAVTSNFIHLTRIWALGIIYGKTSVETRVVDLREQTPILPQDKDLGIYDSTGAQLLLLDNHFGGYNTVFMWEQARSP